LSFIEERNPNGQEEFSTMDLRADSLDANLQQGDEVSEMNNECVFERTATPQR